jgi:hypothetical protein
MKRRLKFLNINWQDKANPISEGPYKKKDIKFFYNLNYRICKESLIRKRLRYLRPLNKELNRCAGRARA